MQQTLLRCVFSLGLLVSIAAFAEPVKTLIVVPESSGAAREIYAQVTAGVQSNSALHTEVVEINKETKPDWLARKVRDAQAGLVVPIGNKSYKLCYEMQRQHPVEATIVAGGISGKPNGIPTLSLTGSPRSTLEHIRKFMPQVKDIRLVYHEELNGWWYRQASELAEEMELEVIGYKAENLQQGVKLYEKLIHEANKKSSAVWIPLKSIVPSKTILPMLLEKAWVKKLPVISNNPSHTRLGGFMAFYPHHFAMGQQLADYAVNKVKGGQQPQIIGTDVRKIAVNVRTGAHLGLRFDSGELEQFDKVFPVRR